LVKTQIWIAVSVYVLVAIVRKRLGLEVSLYTLLPVFSVTVFEKMSIQSAILAKPVYIIRDFNLSRRWNHQPQHHRVGYPVAAAPRTDRQAGTQAL
jgi:hypothetical protein